MDNNENNLKPLDSETKPKKVGFFRRLRRGFTSIFQRKSNKKRSKSDPCLPEIKNCAAQSTAAVAADRLSVGDTERESPGDVLETADANSSRDPNYRPPARAPMIVNDFTMELKKSLKLRSKMVEEGQTSEAIMQIEMTRSNYSTTEEENLAEIERKTVEEKVALFESQICGGSLPNSLSRTEKLGELSLDTVDDKGDGCEEQVNEFGDLIDAVQDETGQEDKQVGNEIVESPLEQKIDTANEIENPDTVAVVETENSKDSVDAEVVPTDCLEISGLVNETGEGPEASGDKIDQEIITDYEVTVPDEQNSAITDPLLDDWEKVDEKLGEFEISSEETKQPTNHQECDLTDAIETNGSIELVEEKQSQMMSGESLNNGILVTEKECKQIVHDDEILNSI